MATSLTQGAIERIGCADNLSEFKPVLQVIECGSHILSLSDGLYYTPAFLSGNLHELLTSRNLQKGSIVKLTHFVVDKLQNCMVIIILDLEVIRNKCDMAREHVLPPEKAPSSADLLSNGRKEGMAVNLTLGAIALMCHDNFYRGDLFIPVLQVIDVTQLNSRLVVLSDGRNYECGTFVRDLEELDYSSRLQKGSIVKLTNFFVTKFRKNDTSKIIVIIDLDVTVDKCERIGDPVSLHNDIPFSRFDSVDHSNTCDFNQFFTVPSPTGRKARMDMNLTQGAIMRICSHNFICDKEFKPVLQVIDCPNHIILLSDGSHNNMGILSKKLEELVRSRRLQKGSIVELTHFVVSELENRKVIVILDLDVILEECELIQEPVPRPIYTPLLPNMDGLFIR